MNNKELKCERCGRELKDYGYVGYDCPSRKCSMDSLRDEFKAWKSELEKEEEKLTQFDRLLFASKLMFDNLVILGQPLPTEVFEILKEIEDARN